MRGANSTDPRAFAVGEVLASSAASVPAVETQSVLNDPEVAVGLGEIAQRAILQRVVFLGQQSGGPDQFTQLFEQLHRVSGNTTAPCYWTSA